MAKNQELNANNLKSVLWQTILDVRKKKIGPDEANAIAQASRGIMSVVNAEIKIAQLGPAQFSGFLSSGTEPERKRKAK